VPDARILTTHVGSLPRPDDLVAMIAPGVERGDPHVLDARIRDAVEEVVEKQRDAGVDVPSDGEAGKPSFLNYVAERLSGVQIEETVGWAGSEYVPSDIADYPDILATALAGSAAVAEPEEAKGVARVMVNDGPLEYAGRQQLGRDLDNFKAALEGKGFTDAFVPAISPGSAATAMARSHYGSRRELIDALADALAHEYRAIVDAGFIVQIDAPDFGCKHMMGDPPLAEFREQLGWTVEALNRALEGVDPARARIHVCWGNYPGPHHRDVPLADVLDLVYDVNVAGISVEAANPRHQHEWRAFAELPLPGGKYLIPGVVDVCTPYIEHPQVIADRIVRYARVVGADRLQAGTDCGFGSEANRRNVPPDIAFAKLSSLAEGATLASRELGLEARR
jgi:5-methyltetrahydropteroyltriglutamate--homocysteine methyltransferase